MASAVSAAQQAALVCLDKIDLPKCVHEACHHFGAVRAPLRFTAPPLA